MVDASAVLGITLGVLAATILCLWCCMKTCSSSHRAPDVPKRTNQRRRRRRHATHRRPCYHQARHTHTTPRRAQRDPEFGWSDSQQTLGLVPEAHLPRGRQQSAPEELYLEPRGYSNQARYSLRGKRRPLVIQVDELGNRYVLEDEVGDPL